MIDMTLLTSLTTVSYGNLLDDYSHCCYPDCNAELRIIQYQDDLATIERLDDSIGHIKSNCAICCMKFNVIKKSNHQSVTLRAAVTR